VLPLPGLAYVGAFIGISLVSALAFLADRLLAPDLPGFASTLVFPLAWVGLETASSRVNPYGTWGCLGYTQAGDLPLTQLASVSGISGIAFLIGWFASVVNWAWDHDFAWAVVGPGVLAYGAVLGAVYLAGGARLARSGKRGRTVRVAGIGWPAGVIEQRELMRLYALPLTDPERISLRDGFRRVHRRLLEATAREARAGATIVVWPEAGGLVFAEDEAEFLVRSQDVAREEGVYLLMGMATIRLDQARPVENKAVLIDPSGEIRWSYVKVTAAGAEARVNVRGTAPIPSDDTPYGRLASPICFDMDFPWIVRETGRARVDLLLVPASDWGEIGRIHLEMAVFRAVENGAAMVRTTRWGHSAATDPYGRVLSFMDDFAARDGAMVAHVPVAAGVGTVYARVGDWLGWLCVAGLGLLVVLHAIR
jgi:apolipoprotein N-acyltransferase